MLENIQNIHIYDKHYVYSVIKILSLVCLLLPAAAGGYSDGMGYLELRLAPGFPPLPLFLDGKHRGFLTDKFRRFYLKTGAHRIRITRKSNRNSYHLSVSVSVSEDITVRHTLKPHVRGTKKPVPHIIRPGKNGTGKQVTPPRTAPERREIHFIRTASRPGTRVYLILDGTRLGWIREGRIKRVVRKTGRKYHLRVVVYRGYYMLEKHKLITLDRAVGPRKVFIYY